MPQYLISFPDISTEPFQYQAEPYLTWRQVKDLIESLNISPDWVTIWVYRTVGDGDQSLIDEDSMTSEYIPLDENSLNDPVMAD